MASQFYSVAFVLITGIFDLFIGKLKTVPSPRQS